MQCEIRILLEIYCCYFVRTAYVQSVSNSLVSCRCHCLYKILSNLQDKVDFSYLFAAVTGSGRPSILGVHDVLSSGCTVIYLPPDNDGGAAVTGYLLERRSPGLEWIRLNDTPVTGLKHVADNLALLTEYQFRVAAVNKFGISSFSDASEMITTKAPSVPDEPR